MTDKVRIRIEIGIIATLVSAAAGGSAGWAGFGWRLTNLEERISQTGRAVDRIDQRVAEMYCATLPVEKRAGCR